ncbi:MAG TPA: hypothetical protein VIH29_01440 [Gallionella sp.]
MTFMVSGFYLMDARQIAATTGKFRVFTLQKEFVSWINPHNIIA